MLLGVIDGIWDFFLRLTTNGLGQDLLFYIGIGFVVIMVLFFMVKSRYAYEGRLSRSLEKINRWLYVHQQIDENNLVQFNSIIKTAPKLLRYHWQQYMLYRENAPSHYMSVYNCIEKPLHTSSYSANIKSFTYISAVAIAVVFLLNMINYGTTTLTVESITISLIAPAIMLIFTVVFNIALRATQNFTLSSLYQNFSLFNRYVDKASTTIPKYVDFEILFTRKEIKGGIPVLNEYLEKRARQEAEELEKARQNAIEHEVYSFESTGIDGSLILDRAMKESETYLNSRQRLLTQIQQYESEIESLRRNYENTSKDYQRKLQASKENIERLRTQQEESTNRIEVNYLRKQQQDEIKKQEQLEKDQDSATARYDQETSVLKEQIDRCRSELADKKNYVQSVMLSEYDTFSTKIYKSIVGDLSDKHKAELDELAAQKEDVLRELETVKESNQLKDSVIDDLKELIQSLTMSNYAAAAEAEANAQDYQEPVQDDTVSEIDQMILDQQILDEIAQLEAEAQAESVQQEYAEYPVEDYAQEVYQEPVQEYAEVYQEEQPVEEYAQEEQPVEEYAQEQQPVEQAEEDVNALLEQLLQEARELEALEAQEDAIQEQEEALMDNELQEAIEEQPVEAAVEETPVAEEIPAEETVAQEPVEEEVQPVVEEQPVETVEEPVAEAVAVEEVPAQEEQPAEETEEDVNALLEQLLQEARELEALEAEQAQPEEFAAEEVPTEEPAEQVPAVEDFVVEPEVEPVQPEEPVAEYVADDFVLEAEEPQVAPVEEPVVEEQPVQEPAVENFVVEEEPQVENFVIEPEVEAVQPVEEEYQPQVDEPVAEQFVQEPVAEEIQPTEEQAEDEEGHYDENGYYWFPNGTYYDDKGLYHDEYGNIYDEEGNFIQAAPVAEEVSQVEPQAVEQEQPMYTYQEEQPAQDDGYTVQDFAVAEDYAQPVAEDYAQPMAEDYQQGYYAEQPAEYQPESYYTEQPTEYQPQEFDAYQPQEEYVQPVEEEYQPYGYQEQPVDQYAGYQPVEDVYGGYQPQEEYVQPVEEPTYQEFDYGSFAQEQPQEEYVQPVEEEYQPYEYQEEQPVNPYAGYQPAGDVYGVYQPQEQVDVSMFNYEEQPQEGAQVEEEFPQDSPPDEDDGDPVLPPKGRGRPKKSSTDAKPQTESRRGRPRKTETTEEVVSTSTGKRGRPKGSSTSSTANKTTSTTSTGKRGRPKGSTTAASVAKKTTGTGQRGRPKGSTTSSRTTTSTAKRGRPKKETVDALEVPKTPGKRGRPRKNINELTELSSQILAESTRLMRQQNELNRQLGETLQQIEEHQDEQDDE